MEFALNTGPIKSSKHIQLREPRNCLNLILWVKIPIFISNELLTKINMILEDKYDIKRITESENKIENCSVEDLKSILQNFIDNEDYENASLIRDEINKKNKVEQG